MASRTQVVLLLLPHWLLYGCFVLSVNELVAHTGAYKLSQYCAMEDFGVVCPPHVCLLQRLCGKLPAAGY